MLFFVLTLTVLCSTEIAGEKCKGELGTCLAGMLLEGHKGLPVSLEQVDTLCRSYKIGMECVEKWNRECLTPEAKLKAERHTASAQFFMGMLCTDGDFKKEYLNHTDCFAGVTRDWDRCNGYFQDAVNDVNHQGRLSYTQRTVDLCCARYGFNRCISLASRAKCTAAGAVFLRRVSETLSHESRCEHFRSALCSAGDPALHGLLLLLALAAPLIALVL